MLVDLTRFWDCRINWCVVEMLVIFVGEGCVGIYKEYYDDSQTN